jgi:hypothetical protein
MQQEKRSEKIDLIYSSSSYHEIPGQNMLGIWCFKRYNFIKGRWAMTEVEIGKITHYFGHVGAGIIELTDALKVGDKIHIKGHSADFTQDIISMQIEHKDVTEAKAGEQVGVKLDQKVHQHDVVYKIIA